MNFSEFQSLRAGLLRDRPEVVDCAETNLYRALARLTPPPTPDPVQQVHRCHLAAEWCGRFGFPAETSRRALISCGVRDSLARLFRHCADTQATLWLPADNYPVYGELARGAGCIIYQFPTLPEPVWPASDPSPHGEVLLVTNPLKPLGRALSDADVSALKRWLAASPQRRVWLDAVYTFGTVFDAGTLALLDTEQTLLLHSLTKGWLQPRLFGIALAPERDAEALTPLFRQNPPPQLSLARARECLGTHAGTPAAVAEALGAVRGRMLECATVAKAFQTATIHESPKPVPGYFIPVRRNWQDLLAGEGILGLSAEVFGSDRGDITILSTLSFAE